MLVDKGYEVTVGSRTETSLDGSRHVQIDRADDDDFVRATAGDHDLFVDIVAFNERHARQLMRLEGRVASLVVVSTAAVYADAGGKSWLESKMASGHPITETDPVVVPVPDGSDYAGGKVAIETTLLNSDLPVTILRPRAIFGPGDQASREWWFVKRVVDGRETVLLADAGRGTFHPVSSSNVAEVIAAAGERPGRRAVNCGDPSPKNIRGICSAVAGVMEHEWDVVDIGTSPGETLGVTPWTTPHSIVMDVSVAGQELGCSGTVSYEASLEKTIGWLLEATEGGPWQEALPTAATYYGNLFDYEAEDVFLERSLRQ